MEDIERTLLVKNEVFVYTIPPRPSARGYRAADWNLATPDWTGRMRVLVKGKKCDLRLEDKSSGELFAVCPVEHYPGSSVEPVTDSSRYFVICLQDSGRKAYIGLGFADRSDSFDLNVSLQDHFKWLKKEDDFSKEATLPEKPSLDLAFKAGQTIRINIPKKDGGDGGASGGGRNKASGSGSGSGLLPPPPGGAGAKIAPPPPGAANLTPLQSPSEPQLPSSSSSKNSVIGSNLDDLLGGLSMSTPSSGSAAAGANTASAGDADPWGDFASAPSNTTVASGKWEQFS